MSAGALGSFLLSARFATKGHILARSLTLTRHSDSHNKSSVLINVAGTGKAAQSSTRFAHDMSVPLSNRGSHNAQFAMYTWKC
jgi:hypothetical protein